MIHDQFDEALLQYAIQGYTRPQLIKWLKDQHIGYFKRWGMLDRMQKNYKDHQKKELRHQHETILADQKRAKAFYGKDLVIKAHYPQPTDFNILKKPKWYSIKYWKYKYYYKFLEDRIIFINLRLKNGNHRSFLVPEQAGGFEYNDGKYIFDNVSKYWHIDAKHWTYDFHQDWCLPINRQIKGEMISTIFMPLDPEVPVNEIKRAIENSKYEQIQFQTNPLILKKTVDAEVIRQLLTSKILADKIAFLTILVIITIIAVGINIILSLYLGGKKA